jgi:hypothetical protein
MKFLLVAVIITHSPSGNETQILRTDHYPTARQCFEAEKPFVDAYLESEKQIELTDDHETDSDEPTVVHVETFCTADSR